MLDLQDLSGGSCATSASRSNLTRVCEADEAYLCVAGLITQVEESSDAILRTCRGIVLDKAEPAGYKYSKARAWKHIPLALSSVHVDDGFARLNLSKPSSKIMNILVSDLW